MKKLMSMLKVIPDNVRVLHRNLIGAGWFADHKELGKIYDALDGVADDVMEIAISLGNQEPSLAEAAAEYESIGGRAYTNEQVWGMVRAMLLDLHEELGAQEGKVPGDVWNKLEEHQYYLNKLANYKVASRLNKRAVQAAAPEQGEAYTAEELQEAFTKAGLETNKYTTEYLAERLGFRRVNEEVGKASGMVRDYQTAKKAGGMSPAEEESRKAAMRMANRANRSSETNPMPIPGPAPKSTQDAQKLKQFNDTFGTSNPEDDDMG